LSPGFSALKLGAVDVAAPALLGAAPGRPLQVDVLNVVAALKLRGTAVDLVITLKNFFFSVASASDWTSAEHQKEDITGPVLTLWTHKVECCCQARHFSLV
jgi:hypothetical protein